MIKRHISFTLSDLKPLNFCGNIIGYEGNVSGYELPFDIEPTLGEHDFNKCEGCKKNLNKLTIRLTEKFEGTEKKKGFPYCCTPHSNLVKSEKFSIASFINVPEMVAKKIIYTQQHIVNNCNSENWLKKITDYIEWAVISFGQMPTGSGESLYLSDYFFYVKDMLKRNKDIPDNKQAPILEFINSYQIPNKQPKSDLNILLSTYEKWYKTFPFELNSYFGNLKQHFEKRLPILNGSLEVNTYSGMAKAKIHTKSSLIEALVNLTDSLLTQINGVTLHENGLITDANKIKLELAINSRKLKLKQGYKNSSPNEEQRYRRILKEWFNDEKKFIDEIIPLIKTLPSPMTDLYDKNEIAMKLIGLTGNYNESKTIQPVYYYINDVLNEYNITPQQGREIVLQMKGSVSPEWNKNVIPFIIDHLRQMAIPQKETKVNSEHNPYPRIFKNADSFLLFESLKNDVRERFQLADYSFIYRRMQKDGYIYPNVVDTEFRDFLRTLSIEIDKTKLLDYCKTDQKESSYTTKKGLFKHL